MIDEEGSEIETRKGSGFKKVIIDNDNGANGGNGYKPFKNHEVDLGLIMQFRKLA
jgi:hypothetical protein